MTALTSLLFIIPGIYAYWVGNVLLGTTCLITSLASTFSWCTDRCWVIDRFISRVSFSIFLWHAGINVHTLYALVPACLFALSRYMGNLWVHRTFHLSVSILMFCVIKI